MKLLLSLALVTACCLVSPTWAGDACQRCGSCDQCCKYCRYERGTKKVPKITYTVECEDFCIPGKSKCEVVCDPCGKRHVVQIPTCGKVCTRKKLVKKEEDVEKPDHKWVVETLCCHCACARGAEKTSGALATDGGSSPLDLSEIEDDLQNELMDDLASEPGESNERPLERSLERAATKTPSPSPSPLKSLKSAARGLLQPLAHRN